MARLLLIGRCGNRNHRVTVCIERRDKAADSPPLARGICPLKNEDRRKSLPARLCELVETPLVFLKKDLVLFFCAFLLHI